jgi:N-acetylneuraminate synthase
MFSLAIWKKMKPNLILGGRPVGPDYPPLVIAEIGINHGGSVDVAKQMIDTAAGAGAEIIKLQSHDIADEMSHHAKAIIPGNATRSIYDIMSDCALSAEDEATLKQHTERHGMIFLSTPFSRKAADRLAALNVVGFKIGSGECNNYPLVKHIAGFGKPVILSTGMNSLDSIRPSVEILRAAKAGFALLHCTNIYPTDPQLVRLGAISQLAKSFPDAVVGLSDHTVSNATCIGAVAVGASILERHFTDRKDRVGPDIVCSMDPAELRQLISWSEIVRQASGGEKLPLAEEAATIEFAYASVVSTRAIRQGELFSAENISVKRPGTGQIPAAEYERLLGRGAVRDIDFDEQIRWSDVH